VPQVTTILDVIYKRFPETHAGILRYGMAVLVPIAARRSRRVIAISEAGKADIVELLGVPPERVDVTLLGPGLSNDGPSVPEDELRKHLGLGQGPIVLTVSAKRPHKNLGRLLEAFGRLPEASDAVLVVPGYATTFEQELQRGTPAGARNKVRFVGWLEDAELDGLYRAATCLVFPSLAEGFGLPVLEAMIRGTPVACSSASSLPEVAGEAALYFDPTDVEAITRALRQMLEDPTLRAQLRQAGFDRARGFSWGSTARATVSSYERALATARS
jgi:glycosyltransferase involved in cell wall biosynthesis